MPVKHPQHAPLSLPLSSPSGAPTTRSPLLKKCIALLQTCTSLSRLKQIHAHTIRHGHPVSCPLLAKHLIFSLLPLSPDPMPYAGALLSLLPLPLDVFTLNTVIRGHAESPDPLPALHLYRRHMTLSPLPTPPDTHTYPFLLKALAKLMDLREGEKVHALATKNGHDASVFVQNALVSFYGACGSFESAHRVFEGMRARTLVSWNSVINGFAVNGRPNEALTVLRELWAEQEDEMIRPDGFTIVSLFTACAELGALALGRRAHVYLFKAGLDGNVHVGNSLIDLYAKCGCVADARKVFDDIEETTVVSWNSLIVGLALNGDGKEALDLFSAMESEGLVPTEITFIGVLYACSHCGWVEDGFRFFRRMRDEYRIPPKIEHYGCMVDLLGRAGMVEEAYRFIIKLPVEPNAIVWRALLGACAMHKRVAFGEAAWAQLEWLDPGHSGDYVLLSNLYASGRRWADVQHVRKSMAKDGVKKTPGYSLVELGNRVHEFVMGDRSHPDSDEIYDMLEEIALRLRQEGYMARTTNVLADIEEEEKETTLRYHSERLAIAYALLKTAPGVPVRIVKNLRVCEDCHLATKLMSKVYGREIIVRDRSRFHHFRDGSCSCKDYW